MAAVTSDACVVAQEREGEAVAITYPARPALYA
jgi:myo-inositol 2-dehydrogenase/D-chiro-inositol 1-dehydrogenase